MLLWTYGPWTQTTGTRQRRSDTVAAKQAAISSFIDLSIACWVLALRGLPLETSGGDTRLVSPSNGSGVRLGRTP
jgi:hypothetical protein